MKIKETIERECCHPSRDLMAFAEHCAEAGKYRWCKHCGRWWTTERRMDAAGGMDSELVKMPWPWEAER